MSVYISKDLARYNLLGNEPSWCVKLRLPNGKFLSATWERDDEPDADPDSSLPSEVVEVISERIESYLYLTGRDEKRELIAYARTVATEMDIEWLEHLIKKHEAAIHRLKDELAYVKEREE